MASAKFYGTGRRKKSIARVYLVPGTGKITINKRDIDEYLGLETLKLIVRQPLVATETVDKFDVLVNVHGGGFSGQAGAIRHGISRALLHADAPVRQRKPARHFEEGRLPHQRPENERKKEVRPQGCPSRSAVQQALISIQNSSKTPKPCGFRGFSFSDCLACFGMV